MHKLPYLMQKYIYIFSNFYLANIRIIFTLKKNSEMWTNANHLRERRVWQACLGWLASLLEPRSVSCSPATASGPRWRYSIGWLWDSRWNLKDTLQRGLQREGESERKDFESKISMPLSCLIFSRLTNGKMWTKKISTRVSG